MLKIFRKNFFLVTSSIILLLVLSSFFFDFAKSRLTSEQKDIIKYRVLSPFYIQNLREKNSKYNNDLFKFISSDLMEIDNQKLIELKEKRSLILDNYILNSNQINYEKINLDETTHVPASWFCENKQQIDFCRDLGINNEILKNEFELHKVSYYSIDHYALLERSDRRKNKKLLIYNQGHKGSPFLRNQENSSHYFIDIRDEFMAKGYDVMSLSMTGLGYNSNQDIDFPNYKNDDPKNHFIYSNYFDKNFPNKEPLSLMLSGNYFLIKKILEKNNYDEIVFVGISGGGFYATVLSAIITEVKTSYSFAGTIPIIFQNMSGCYECWENHQSSLFSHLSYNDLYLLSTFDQNFNIKRNHNQIYFTNDTGCFKNPFAELLVDFYDFVDYENINFVLLEQNEHIIDSNFLFDDYFKK